MADKIIHCNFDDITDAVFVIVQSTEELLANNNYAIGICIIKSKLSFGLIWTN